ncbi:MAG: Rpn family recombination-promoting nuclease/putative transposase [Candidatus Wallbacteria bacterium]|nr:Rpn family recombination-promoting nuclease/putative transposase [Candidatus Wallbacteria bacterium]
MVRVSLLNDVIFKIVFGSEEGRPLLKSLLNAVLEHSGEVPMAEVELLNPNLDKAHLLEKGVLLDVKARDDQGRLYNIEVQVASEPAYVERALYYVARLFGDQLGRGESYRQLARTIGISLVDFVLFPEFDEVHSRYRLHDAAHGRELTDVLELHFIELKKFRRDQPEKLRSRFEQWLHLLEFGEQYEREGEPLPDSLAREEEIDMAVQAMRKAYARSDVREMMELLNKADHDWATRLETAEMRGLEKGLEKGRQEGRQEGMEKGSETATVEIAKRMLHAGLPLETVEQVTGMSREKLESLKS